MHGYVNVKFLSLVKITGGIDVSNLMVERLVPLWISLGPADIDIISSTSKWAPNFLSSSFQRHHSE